MSIKIKAICRKGQSPQNQTTTIYLRLTINRKSRYVSTGVKIPTSYWDFDNQDFSIDCPQFQCKVYEQIDKLHRRIKRLEALEIALTFDNILEDKQRRTNCTLREYFDRVITKLLTSGKVGTASKYQITSSLLSQVGLANQRLEDLATNDLRDFELFLVKRGNKPNSVATKFSALKAVYNKALAEKIFVCKENPFAMYKVGSHWTKTRKRAIRKEDVQKLMNAPLPDSRSPYTELARDIFLFPTSRLGSTIRILQRFVTPIWLMGESTTVATKRARR